MALSEKLYELRKKDGLSQEQLAERLGVSRQAVSKWESGKAVPESDTLISISEYFNVSLTANNTGREKRIIGMVACVGGIICLIIWGLISVLMPSTSDQIGGSSMITIDGNGIFLLICLVAIVAGAVLLLKSTSNK